MEFVLDANVLISALIKDSHVRHFILLSGHSFYVPEFIFEEIKEHINEIKDKTMLHENQIIEILDQIMVLGNIKIIPLDDLKDFRESAENISPDIDDIHYVALALKLKCAIWSNDKELKQKQNIIKIYT